MVPKEFLLIARDAADDRFAAELANALRTALANVETGYDEGVQPLHASVEPRFYGLGGPTLAAGGVELIDSRQLAEDGAGGWSRARHALKELFRLAMDREPHAVIFVGSRSFNPRFAGLLKREVARHRGTFSNWEPLVVQIGIPEPWNSNPRKARNGSRAIDLLLTSEGTHDTSFVASAPELRIPDAAPKAGVGSAGAAERAAAAIVERLLDQEAHFPLKAFLRNAA